MAYGVRPLVTADAASGMAVGAAAAVPRLAPGASARIEVPVTAPVDARDGRVALTVTVAEANGFGRDAPRRLTLPVRAARPPRLALAGLRIDDQSGDGRIAPRELVDVTVRIWNTGLGPARDVKASLSTGDDTFLIEETARQLTLGTMAPSEHRDVSFALYTNTRARDVRVIIPLTEATGRFGATLTVPFPIDRPVTQTLDVAVAEPPRSDSTRPVTPSLVDEIDRDLPQAAEPNPDAIAVVIGVERYASLPTARYAARDAQLFRRYAAAAFGVTDDRNHLYVRTDADAIPAADGCRRRVPTRDGLFSRHALPAARSARCPNGHHLSRRVLHGVDAIERDVVFRSAPDRHLRRTTGARA
jgi:hypothetical protein